MMDLGLRGKSVFVAAASKGLDSQLRWSMPVRGRR